MAKARYSSVDPVDFAENKEGDILPVFGESNKPFKGGSTYIGKNASTAGAGRGGQGGPTAKQAAQNRGMMDLTERAVREQQDFDMYAKERPEQKYAKGGKVSSASSRADGCCTKGKTRGKYL